MKISREHFMTNNITSMFKKAVPSRFQMDGKKISDRKFGEVAKVLCERHNSMFGKMFDPVGINVTKFILHVMGQPKSFKHLLINGHDLERFVMQRLCANSFGKQYAINGRTITTTPSVEILRSVFVDLCNVEGAGLYGVEPAAHCVSGESAVESAPIVGIVARNGVRPDTNTCSDDDMILLGARVTIRNLAFAILFENRGFGHMPRENYRPRALAWHRSSDNFRTGLLEICWNPEEEPVPQHY